MPVDYHIHTSMCGHAEGDMEQYVEAAIRNGLKEIGFSDHIPMYFLPEGKRDLSIAMKEGELPLYIEKVRKLQKKYCPYPIKLGIEADYTPGKEEELASILKKYEFDYVLGSIHFLNGWGFDNSQYISEYDNWDLYQLYELYFSTLGQAAASGLFDTMAHPDLIKKFGFKPQEDVLTLYEDAVKKIAAAEVCVELSTAGLRVPAGDFYPDIRFLQLCAHYEVPVSLGSDAHKPEQVGVNFNESINLLKSLGYTKVVTFTQRKRGYCLI